MGDRSVEEGEVTGLFFWGVLWFDIVLSDPTALSCIFPRYSFRTSPFDYKHSQSSFVIALYFFGYSSKLDHKTASELYGVSNQGMWPQAFIKFGIPTNFPTKIFLRTSVFIFYTFEKMVGNDYGIWSQWAVEWLVVFFQLEAPCSVGAFLAMRCGKTTIGFEGKGIWA